MKHEKEESTFRKYLKLQKTQSLEEYQGKEARKANLGVSQHHRPSNLFNLKGSEKSVLFFF